MACYCLRSQVSYWGELYVKRLDLTFKPLFSFMVVVWYVAFQQAKRLLAMSPLQPIGNRRGILETAPPREEITRSSGSPQLDEEIERVN